MAFPLTLVLLIVLLLSGTASATPVLTGVNEYLAPQNAARRALRLPPLRWDRKLEAYAQWWGNQRRYDCSMLHSNGPYGENIFWGAGDGWTPRQAVAGWLSERRFYDYSSNTCRAVDCGHYTQIIWRATMRVGCAKVTCFAGAGTLFICDYDPPGNFSGERPY
ncbi:hypothetical protein Nepgr_019662 [Nepenthes gracilis]|uniref:SCP domain-containing protein n=1 Tax=Nepenthes gracilis TaxID=150966 RepID=A0AAD3XVJ9_NEPGR|nr:hypothetical protein Nepgr_019662 [Nepenthes gracilis]